jgi:hypothetical protein
MDEVKSVIGGMNGFGFGGLFPAQALAVVVNDLLSIAAVIVSIATVLLLLLLLL